jgi:hypothetical protein
MVPECFRDLAAELVPIEVGKFRLNALSHQNQIYIPTNEGLRIIGVDIRWIASQRKSGRRCPLFRRGFSFQEKLLCYPMGDDGKFFFAGSYTWSDWLIVWEYFAAQGNSKAASILKALAEYGLTSFLSSVSQKT